MKKFREKNEGKQSELSDGFGSKKANRLNNK